MSQANPLAPLPGRPASPAIDIGPLLDDGRWSGYQKAVVALAALGIVFDGVDVQLLGIAVPAIMGDWNVERSAFAPILSIGLVGMALGTALGGIVGDRIGRRRALIGSMLLFGLFTALIGLADSLLSLGALRLLAGLGLGGALPNVTALTSEYTPLRVRAFAITLSLVCFPLGLALAGLVGAEVLPTLGWRWLFVIGGVAPMGIALVLLGVLPESPRYLARHPGRFAELARILERIGHAVSPQSVFVDGHDSAHAGASAADLFGREYRRDTLALWAAFFSCLMSVYIVVNWLPSMLSGAGLDLSVASRSLGAFNLGGVAGALGGSLLIARLGSRVTMVGLAVVAITGAVALSFATIDASMDVSLLVVALGATGGAINGVQTIMYALAAHVYPTAVRATGVGSASAAGRIGAILSPFIGAWALGFEGVGVYFLLIGAAMLSTAVALARIRRHVQPSSH